MVKIVEAELKIEVNDDIKAASIAANIAPLRTKKCKKTIINISPHCKTHQEKLHRMKGYDA